MLTRALIVVLAILNVGVALWWMLRGEPAPVPPAMPSGVARLQLLDTPPAAAPAAAPAARSAALDDVTPTPPTSAPPATAEVAPGAARPPAATAAAATPASIPAPTPPAAPATPVALRCISLGPFADRDTAMAAQGKAGALVQRSRLREVPKPGASSTYRVMMPAAASRDEAQAMVKRIAAAGISDYYIMGQGDDANAIALGQYRNREGAERRLAALSAAGFTARLVASGGAEGAQWWIDAALADTASAGTTRQRSGAAQQRSLECAGLR
ncbi:SPOR domain-containing protein [Stenotrophomonas sp.]|uniref:SPOR domain-containing protein n=1 Tax=Stenotrophomonas sp. TaxID=69392 RepID=UPI0028AF2539|nr:SPOR domain-containing protein [Stenotrophomonas sp.]